MTPGENLGLRVVMPGFRARVQRDEHSGAWRPNSIGKEGGKAQLLRRGAFRLRRDVGRPTTPCPTPMSDPETGPFSGAQICSAGKRRFPCPPGPKPLETQMLLAPHSFVEQRTYMWVLYPVPTPQCPSPWSLQAPAAQPFPGPHAQGDPLPTSPRR